jgi:anti-anti-sigma factor
LGQLVSTTSASTIVVDLSDLPYCDASGLNVFAQAQCDAAHRGKTIMLAHPRPMVQQVFDIVQFGRVVTINTSSGGTDDRKASAGGWEVSSESS